MWAEVIIVFEFHFPSLLLSPSFSRLLWDSWYLISHFETFCYHREDAFHPPTILSNWSVCSADTNTQKPRCLWHILTDIVAYSCSGWKMSVCAVQETGVHTCVVRALWCTPPGFERCSWCAEGCRSELGGSIWFCGWAWSESACWSSSPCGSLPAEEKVKAHRLTVWAASGLCQEPVTDGAVW